MKTAPQIEAWLTEQIAGILSIPEEEIDPTETFDSFGLASRDAVSLSGDLEDYLERRLSPTLLYQYPTIRELAEHLAQAAKPAVPKPSPMPAGKPGAHEERAAAAQVVAAPPPPPAQGGSTDTAIAVVGLAGRFPGADSAEAFWDALAAGRDLISEVPDERWEREALYDPEPGKPGKMSTKWGGFLSDIAGWDARFFGVSPREAARMDPQQRLLCEAAWEALEDAGIPADRLAGSNTGVFVGISSPDYSRLQIGVAEHVDAYTGVGNALSVAANRISYLFDFHGPSLAVDTACSSSLVAAHLACQSLARRECDVALAGGVNVILSPEVTISFSHAHMMAADGRCKTFDAAADGYARGEGVGVVALKRLADAERDGDRILAVILGSAVNQDGRSNGLTAPNPEAQAAVIRQALANARVAPGDVSYVEAHGTGTALGDPIELRALADVFGPGRSPAAALAIASVKTNIGHLESAAGIAGLIKVCLMLQRGEIPPSLHFHRPNPHFDFAAAPLRVQTASGPWVPPGAPRIAGISSFGFGGANAHVIVAERVAAPAAAPQLPDEDAERPCLLALSATTADALEGQARRWIEFLETTDAAPARIASAAATARSHHDHRLSAVGKSAAEWRAQLEAFVNHESATGLAAGQRMSGKRHRVALIYSGQGTQWSGMGIGLLAEPSFAEEAAAIDALWQSLAGWSIVDALRKGDALDQTAVAQPAIFALQAGLTAVLRSWGLAVEGAAGHSIGDVTAAYAGGILSREDAVRVLYHRSRLMQAATGLGKMAAVGVSEAEARELLRGREAELSIAAINSPSLVTVSGGAGALDVLLDELKAHGVFHRPLGVNYAFHSPQMDAFLAELRERLDDLQPQPAKLAVFSTVTGAAAGPSDYGPDYWPRNVRQTVRFLDAVRGMADAGFDAFVEVSPHAGMVRSIAECLPPGNGYVVTGSLQRGKPERETLLAAAGQLYCAGLTPSWPPGRPPLPRVEIPRYAWNRQRYWTQATPVAGLSAGSVALRGETVPERGHPLAGREVRSPALRGKVYEQIIGAQHPAYLADHWVAGAVVLPATAYVEMALAAGARALGATRVSVENLSLERALALSAAARTAQVVVEGERVSIYSDDGRGWQRHATATVRAFSEDPPAETVDLAATSDRCGVVDVSTAGFYARLRERGLEYGPAFRGVVKLWQCAGEALGRVGLPPGLSANGYILHPALLDACFHVVAAALPDGPGACPDVVYLPVAIERVTVTPEGEGLATAWAHVTVRETNASEVVADVRLANDNGAVVATAAGLRLRAAPRKALEMMLADAAADTQEAEPAPEDVDGWAYETGWEEVPALGLPAGKWAAGRWLLLPDEGGVAARLAAALAEAGGDVKVVDREDDIASAAQGAAASGATLRGLIHLPGLDADKAPDGFGRPVRSAFEATKAVARLSIRTRASARLWIVTRGAVSVKAGEGANPAGSALWGFGNVAALEHGELRPARIDLDSTAEAERQLLAELARPDGEDRVALRGTRRFGARLKRAALPATAAKVAPLANVAPLRLEITERGMLDNLARVPMTRIEPAAGQVEIEVRAAGLNFRDVMNLLGLYPGDAGLLGGECSGIVARVGAGVAGVKPGDRVLAIAPGSFGAYTTTLAALVAPVPGGLTFEEAATIPIAFLTAHYALNVLGKLQAGESVLVHAASGGVGLAAIQLARLAGAEVYATAGSPAKREFLSGLGLAKVMNSRNLAFSEETLAATGGRGVDLVLNSLSGDFIPKSLAALAPAGRFIEIGKVGIWDAGQVAKARPRAAYHTIALDDLSARQPELIAEMLAGLLPHFEAGRLRPLTSTVYPVEDAASAFRLMAQTRHIGKVVITQPERAAAARVLIRPDATYLITGGLGSLGMLVAARLVELGARNLLLVGVTEPSDEARAKIAALEQRGARVVVWNADVGRGEGAQAALEAVASEEMPLLRGIVHAAGVLDDGMIAQQEWPRFERVLQPKAGGAWNLHRLTNGADLDFFVMFSSVASVLGSPGQANYAAANAFLDGLAARRVAEGAAGLSINWGPWSVGMAAAGDDRDRKRRDASGLAAIEPEKGLEAFERLLLAGATGQVMIAPVAWPLLRRHIAAGYEPAFLKPLLAAVPAPQSITVETAADEEGKPPLVRQLEAAAPRERLPLLVSFISARTLRVLALDPDTALDTRKPMNEMGLDSLMAVELKNALDAGVGRRLPATLVFEHPTIEAMARHLLDDVLALDSAAAATASEVDNKAETSKPGERSAAVTEAAVAEMTEEEAEAALLRKLLELDE